MPKRIATSELNHDNWNEEDAPEEAGTFQKAAPDVIEKRVIRNARRRVVGGSGSGTTPTSVFAGFQGFGKTTENPGVFSFLKKSNATTDKTGVESKIESSSHTPMFKHPIKEVPISEQNPLQPSPPFTVSYLGAIKKLNECFIKHIQTCFEEKQFIILAPCFRDYEQHLKSILPLNDSSSKGEGENKVFQESTESSSQKKDHEDETSNVLSAKKTNFSSSASAEATPGSGFKFFVSDASKSSPNSNAVTLDTSSPFSAPSKKQFPWSGGWGSNSPSQPVTSEPKNESSKGESVGVNDEATDESDVPPKVEFKQVVEDGAVYSRRCKVFVKKDANYHDHGVGMLFLKPVESGKKTQLIVRADTSLGNLLINTLLSADMTMQRMGNNNVMIICMPTPEFKTDKPLPVLLRVKTSDDADELLQKLKEFKK